MISVLRYFMLGLLLVVTLFKPSLLWANEWYVRYFWDPVYKEFPLNWCLADSKACGKIVAKDYCVAMGYKDVHKYRKAEDIGLSRYMDTEVVCHHANCSGFKWIACTYDKLPGSQYYTNLSRAHTFYFPRLDGVRLDWCYQNGKGCGRRVASAFCRYQGYWRVSDFRPQLGFGLTREMADGRLCVGPKCRAFEQISCAHI